MRNCLCDPNPEFTAALHYGSHPWLREASPVGSSPRGTKERMAWPWVFQEARGASHKPRGTAGRREETQGARAHRPSLEHPHSHVQGEQQANSSLGSQLAGCKSQVPSPSTCWCPLASTRYKGTGRAWKDTEDQRAPHHHLPPFPQAATGPRAPSGKGWPLWPWLAWQPMVGKGKPALFPGDSVTLCRGP